MTFIEAIAKSLATYYAMRGQKMPSKKDIVPVALVWAHALNGISPDLILAATRRAFAERKLVELHDVVEIARSMCSESSWVDAFTTMLRLSKTAKLKGQPSEAVARGYLSERSVAMRQEIQQHPDPVIRAIGEQFVDSLVPRDGYPNLDTVRAQFRDAYKMTAEAIRAKTPPVQMIEVESYYAESLPSNHRRTLGPGRTSPVDTIGPAVGGAIGSG